MAPDQNNNSIDLITISQAIVSAHQHSFERQEALLHEIRDQPKRFLDIQRYEQANKELERRVGVLEDGFRELTKDIAALPDRIMSKIEARTNISRTQVITISIAIANGLIAIALSVFSALRH